MGIPTLFSALFNAAAEPREPVTPVLITLPLTASPADVLATLIDGSISFSRVPLNADTPPSSTYSDTGSFLPALNHFFTAFPVFFAQISALFSNPADRSVTISAFLPSISVNTFLSRASPRTMFEAIVIPPANKPVFKAKSAATVCRLSAPLLASNFSLVYALAAA